jgi:DNA-binding transcriptional ArsR family regulator
MEPDPEPELLQFFKAMADENRLKIVGLLAQDSHSGETLADLLGIRPATVSHHLARLAEAGLVSSRMEGHAKLYSLRLDAMHEMANRLLAHDTLPRTAADVDVAAYEQKVLSHFMQPPGTPGPRLTKIPGQQKKFQVVLASIVADFETGRRYSEREVNEILAGYHVDTASLRRAMIEYKLMERAGGYYWRLERNAV